MTAVLLLTMLIPGLYMALSIVADIQLLRRRKSGVVLGWIVMACGTLMLLFGLVGLAGDNTGAAAIRLTLRLPFLTLWVVALVKAQAYINQAPMAGRAGRRAFRAARRSPAVGGRTDGRRVVLTQRRRRDR